MTTTAVAASISYNPAADALPEADIIVVTHDRHSRNAAERLMAMVADRHHYTAIRHDGDVAAARAEAIAHVAERRAQIAVLYGA